MKLNHFLLPLLLTILFACEEPISYTDNNTSSSEDTSINVTTLDGILGTWNYSATDPDDSSNYTIFNYTFTETTASLYQNNSGTEETKSYSVTYSNTTVTLTDNSSGDVTTYDYRVDDNNLVLFNDDETDSNTAVVFTIDGYSGSDHNDGASILETWGWGSSDIEFIDTTTASFGSYTYNNNILDISGSLQTVYIFSDVIIMDGGYGNTVYIYKKR